MLLYRPPLRHFYCFSVKLFHLFVESVILCRKVNKVMRQSEVHWWDYLCRARMRRLVQWGVQQLVVVCSDYDSLKLWREGQEISNESETARYKCAYVCRVNTVSVSSHGMPFYTFKLLCVFFSPKLKSQLESYIYIYIRIPWWTLLYFECDAIMESVDFSTCLHFILWWWSGISVHTGDEIHPVVSRSMREVGFVPFCVSMTETNLGETEGLGRGCCTCCQYSAGLTATGVVTCFTVASQGT